MPRRALALTAALAACAAPLLAPGSPAAAASSLTAQPTLTTPAYASWYQRSTVGDQFAAPAVGDVDGDGQPEVVAGFPNGHVYVWRTDGTRIRDLNTGAGAVQASPALRDVDGDGALDIIGGNLAGRVFIFSGKTSKVLFSKTLAPRGGVNGIMGTPTVVDLDRDGRLDVVASSFNQDLSAWSLDGRAKPGFPIWLKDTSWSSPAVADLDGDGYLDVVVGYDCEGSSSQECYGKGLSGYVLAVDRKGKRLPGWPKLVPHQVVWSSPAVIDVDGDGRRDVVVGTGVYAKSGGNAVYAWDRTGKPLAGWPVTTKGRVMGSPAVGDVDGDGQNDVVVLDDKNRVYALSRAGKVLPGWPRCSDDSGQCTADGRASAVLADVTGDGRTDVVTAGATTLNVWSGTGALQATAKAPTGSLPIMAAPTVVSLGGVSTVLLTTSVRSGSGWVGRVVRFTTGSPLGATPWAQFKQNAQRTGTHTDVTPPGATTLVLNKPSDSSATAVQITASDGQSGVAVFEAYKKDGSGPLQKWLLPSVPSYRNGPGATINRGFTGTSGHTYTVQARARDAAGNWGSWIVKTIRYP